MSRHCKHPINQNRIQIANKIYKKRVLNISESNLTKDEHSILSKGLNFCPTLQETNKNVFYKEIDNLKRHLSLKVHFNKQNEKNDTPYKSTLLDQIVRKEKKNPWQPPHENCISTYTDAIKDQMRGKQVKQPKFNISKNEYTALENLTKRSDIVIKRADKGGATVVCSAQWYEDEAQRQLTDDSFYKKVPEDNTKKHESIITEHLSEFVKENLLDETIAKKLTPIESRTPQFYMFPKIHKSPITGRPVISSTGCHSEKISAFVDEKLRPAVQKLPTYIKDSNNDFLQKMKQIGQGGAEDYLVTLDVSSLYTNIDNDEGINAIKQNASMKEIYSPPVIGRICKLMQLILTLNNFYSMAKSTSKSKVLKREHKLHPTMLIYSWVHSRMNTSTDLNGMNIYDFMEGT